MNNGKKHKVDAQTEYAGETWWQNHLQKQSMKGR